MNLQNILKDLLTKRGNIYIRVYDREGFLMKKLLNTAFLLVFCIMLAACGSSVLYKG